MASIRARGSTPSGDHLDWYTSRSSGREQACEQGPLQILFGIAGQMLVAAVMRAIENTLPRASYGAEAQ